RLKKTQQQVADECGISKSLLSKIENGQTSSAVATLSKINCSLNVSLSWILDDRPETDLVLLQKSHRQLSFVDESISYSYVWLANRSKYSNIELTIVYVTHKNANLHLEPYTHSQDEFIYILEGSIYLLYEDKKTFMNQGDTAYFKGSKPH